MEELLIKPQFLSMGGLRLSLSYLLVPVLVTDQEGIAEDSIIGFNVIECLLDRGIYPPRAVSFLL